MRKINKLNCLVLKKEICRNAICNHNVDCREIWCWNTHYTNNIKLFSQKYLNFNFNVVDRFSLETLYSI